MAASEIEAPKSRAPWLALGVVVLAVVSIAIGMGIPFEKDDDPKNVAVYNAKGDGMDALLAGIVEVTPSCVTVLVGGESWTPVFPQGSTHVANDALEWRGLEFLSGDPIELGGGETSSGGDSVFPAGCPRRHLWLVAPR